MTPRMESFSWAFQGKRILFIHTAQANQGNWIFYTHCESVLENILRGLYAVDIFIIDYLMQKQYVISICCQKTLVGALFALVTAEV